MLRNGREKMGRFRNTLLFLAVFCAGATLPPKSVVLPGRVYYREYLAGGTTTIRLAATSQSQILLDCFVNGLLQMDGTDYTYSAQVVTWIHVPSATDKVV